MKTVQEKYEYQNTHKYLLPFNKWSLDWLTNQTVRSESQTEFLFELCDYDWKKLKKLENQIANTFLGCCPADKESVEEVLNMKVKTSKLTSL